MTLVKNQRAIDAVELGQKITALINENPCGTIDQKFTVCSVALAQALLSHASRFTHPDLDYVDFVEGAIDHIATLAKKNLHDVAGTEGMTAQ